MGTKEQNIQANIPRWGAILLNLPWIQVAGELWKMGHKIWRGYANEGVYEVLDYEATLELLNMKGTQAAFQKRLRVRYLQDNIIAFQDSAWAPDGKSLIVLLAHYDRSGPSSKATAELVHITLDG
jgi:hypothetical protein